MTSEQQPRSRWQLAFELATLTISILMFLFTGLGVLAAAIGESSQGTRDYVEYWSAGQLLVDHRNPYDLGGLSALEHSVGLPAEIPTMVMGNAPPALLLTYPLGYVSAKAGEYLWLLLLLAALLTSVYLVSNALGTTQAYVKILGSSFAAALACIAAGQMALLVLLGTSIFLCFHRTRPFLAGAGLWLCLLKPQLFVPFGLIVLVWGISSRAFHILAGLATALATSAVVVSLLDPGCWTQYAETMRQVRFDRISIPCISMVLRDLTGGSVLVQYFPAVVGCVWATGYYWRHRHHWDWWQHGSPLLLVSLIVPPYTWLVDQCVALPALMYGLSVCRSRAWIAVLALLSAVIETGPLFHQPLLHSRFYLWTTPAWLGWYLIAVRANVHGADPIREVGAGHMLAAHP